MRRSITAISMAALFALTTWTQAGDDCCAEQVCRPVPEKKKISKTTFDCKTESFCLPKCSLESMWPCCWLGNSGCASCEAPRCRKILIKKVRTIECDTFKCVPEISAGVPCHPAPCK